MNLSDSFKRGKQLGTKRLGDVLRAVPPVCQISVVSTAPVYPQSVAWVYVSLHPQFHLPTPKPPQIHITSTPFTM